MANCLVGSLVSVFSSRSSSHTFVAFIDIQKTRHGWKARFVCLMPVSLAACGDSFLSHFFRGIQSQVCSGDSLSAPCTDIGNRSGEGSVRILFNLLGNGLAALVRQAAPGVQFGVSHRFTDQLYADDLVTECKHDVQVALDVVSAWWHQWRFSFGIGPTKSAVVVFDPRRVSLRISPSGRHLDPVIVMDSSCPPPCFPWQPLVHCVAWCKSERLLLRFACPLSCLTCCRACLGEWNFSFHLHPALQVIYTALRRWGRFLLGWPAVLPVGAHSVRLWFRSRHLTSVSMDVCSRTALLLCVRLFDLV